MSTEKDKNETSRFLGEGVSFKAKLIGILEVSEARGDRMCQEALSDLKMAIRAAGEHKQRITISIAIDGLRLRDEKTGDSLYHHPVHKISFIAQDMTDSRAFGYIFGSPDTGHRFFGIKTDKAASQVVIAMRDLFQVVFALKKKEIELAKQHLDKTRYGTSSIFSDGAISSTKALSQDISSNKPTTDTKTGVTNSEVKTEGPAVADLVDLELELNSLQQGITQMERITPSDPFGSKDDPFGDSFTTYPAKLILPPPPSGRERSSRTSESSSIFSPKTPHTTGSTEVIGAADTSTFNSEQTFSFSHDFNSSHEEPSSGDWFTPSSNDKIFEDPPLVPEPTKEQQQHDLTKQEILAQFDVFMELDPLETEFSRQDPFDTEHFGVECKIFNKDIKPTEFAEKFKFPPLSSGENLQPAVHSKLSKSPNKGFGIEKQTSLSSTSPRTIQFNKQNTFDDKISSKISQIHENRSLDISSESECAPEPPPRPTSNLIQIKPPPLPPKKQPGDLCIKPPPRPPYSEDSHYDYMDNYETGPNSLEFIKKLDKSPPLPAPVRKAKFESDFMSPPQRPRKQLNVQQTWSSEEDYLTPISLPKQAKEYRSVPKTAGSILLPPPQKSTKKHQLIQEEVTTVPITETNSNIMSINAQEKLNSLEGLDITLSQLTLSGLNEVASKLNIPTSQLSNMTLVQLTEYISNIITNKNTDIINDSNTHFADFANFNNFNDEPHDKYAVFRELLQEEIKQTKIDTEPEEHIEERKKEEEKLNNLNVTSVNECNDKTDRYAALREIVESEINQTIKGESVEENNVNENEIKGEENNFDQELNDTKIKNETNIIDTEKKLSDKEKDILSPKDQVIEYNMSVEIKTDSLSPTPIKSPIKVKSPVPVAVTEVIQSNTRLTSGSLSDVVSGSSPEIDNTAISSDVTKQNTDATAESWAIFDQPNILQEPNRDKQSEEGISPWSSDSKEFGNGSPPDWRQRTDSGSGADRWANHRKEQEGWWDTSAEPQAQYYPSNRRSGDSYEDEGYEYYDRAPRRRRQMAWSSHGGGGSQPTGGHSSSSRDASPWEEEPRRRDIREGKDGREHREMWSSRHVRQQHSFERQRDRRHADSWDEEDDYEYDEEHSGRYYWPERHGRETERDRHGGSIRERDSDRWADEWNDIRRHRRRKEVDRDRWCCPDWEQDPADQPGRYNMSRWRDRKQEDRYYSREQQDSPWEDDYTNEPEESHSSRYITGGKRNWKRPSSASEMDRKTGETKTRQGQYYSGTGGSDGERDRRYKGTRRSRSRDSQFTEPVMHSRHKIDPNLTMRGPQRSKLHVHQKSPVDTEFSHDLPSKKLDNSKLDLCTKRNTTVCGRKKTKDSPKTEEAVHIFPRKSTMFENNFASSENESPILSSISPRFNFENDFETSEAESPIVSKTTKEIRQLNMFDNEHKRIKSTLRYDMRKTTFDDEPKISPSSRSMQKSPFEDDFSPPVEKFETPLHENISTSSIKEEIDGNEEEEDSFSTKHFERSTIRKKILSKNRLSNSFHIDTNLKKSESVNIFARESDPFDDEFFSGRNSEISQNLDKSPRSSDCKWTDDFEDFNFDGRK